MRLAMYRHLQRLSPRFYARTPLGDIIARVNNDIGEIQRIAAESLLAWVGQRAVSRRQHRRDAVWLDPRWSLVGRRDRARSACGRSSRMRAALEAHVTALRERSADIGSFLIETLQGVRLVVTSNAQEREVDAFRGEMARSSDALMSMQLLSYLSGGVPGLMLTAGTCAVFVYGGHRVIGGTLTLGTFVAFMAYQMRVLPPVQALMGLYCEPGDGPGVARPGAGDCSTRRPMWSSRPTPIG